MSREKTERLFNLTLALLGTRNFLTKSQILASVQGYGGSSEAADRMFERDKDDLRELGIPLEVRQIDPLFDDEPGYRIDRRRYQLPALTFTAHEMALLSVAAQAWGEAAMAAPAAEGLRKLIASGADPEPEASLLAATLRTQEPAFATTWQAVRDNQAISFDYRRAGESEYQARRIDPWGLLARHGLWYLVGRDHEQDQSRVYRLSRMESVKTVGKPGSFQIPQGVDIWAHAYLLTSDSGQSQTARLKIESGRALGLVHRGVQVAPDVIEIEFSNEEQFAREILTFNDAVEVVEPDSLRQRVVGLLTLAVERYG